jgi:hypothetical protein
MSMRTLRRATRKALEVSLRQVLFFIKHTYNSAVCYPLNLGQMAESDIGICMVSGHYSTVR